MSLLAFRYVIEHVPEEVNTWGDLLRRWEQACAKTGTHFKTSHQTGGCTARLALRGPCFVWAAETEIRALQQVAPDGSADLQGVQWSEKR
jgi:hypothetical protein